MKDKHPVDIRVGHMTITDECRKIHGTAGAFQEASDRLRSSFFDLAHSEMHDTGNGSTFTIELRVQYER